MPDFTITSCVIADPQFKPELPLDQIDFYQNARTDLGDLTELAASIAEGGVRQPIRVIREGDRYKVWLGHRRVQASRMAGRTTIPALICPQPTPQKFLADQLVENLQRQDMTEQDKHKGCVDLESLGMSRGAIAESLGVSPGMVTRYFAPAECVAEVKEAFLAGKVSCGDCYQIKKSPDQLATLALRLGGSKRDDLARKPKPSNAVRTEKIKCPLPSGNVVTITGDGLSLEEAADVLAEAARAIKDGIKRGYTAKTFNNAMKDMAAN